VNFKKFLKLDWRKIVITFILLGLSFFYKWHFVLHLGVGHPGVLREEYRGLPLPYWQEWPTTRFLCPRFIVDIIFWYFFSCLIIWAYEKIKEKSK